MANLMLMPAEKVREILDTPPVFANEQEENQCQAMLEELNSEEDLLEEAAGTSYAYWLGKKRYESSTTERDRSWSAMKEARRQLRGEAGNVDKALARFRKTCQFRKDRNVNLVRYCFFSGDLRDTASKDETEKIRHIEKLVSTEMERQSMVVRGYDRDHCAILHRKIRVVGDVDQESYMILMIYMVERVIACTEALSLGTNDKIVGVYEYLGYDSSVIPPTAMVKEVIFMLQEMYPDRAKKIFVLDPPFWMRALYGLVSPFLASDTREKVRFVSGDAKKHAEVTKIVDVEQATDVMTTEGKLTSKLDTNRMLRSTPFHWLYDQEEEFSE